MAEHRWQSLSLGRKRRPPCKPLRSEPIEVLQDFAQSLKNGRRAPQPWTHDLRGNAMSVNSLGHIHHPVRLHQSAVKWLMMVEKLAEAQTFGLRNNLSIAVDCVQYYTENSI